MQLNAVVIGSGWAGEGHTRALRAAGVDVVALCGRTQESAQRLASRLGVAHVRLDWPAALNECRPDIVSIATPAAPHREIAAAAAGQGYHIFCDKPMGLNAEDAKAMLAAVRAAGVKHAYGASGCMSPAMASARNVIASGRLGVLTAVVSQRHVGLTRPLTHGWFHELRQGGGMLNQLFTHMLSQVLFVTGATPVAVVGVTRCDVTRARPGGPVHDFREWLAALVDVGASELASWKPADADTAYTAMLRLSLPGGGDVNASFLGSMTSASDRPEELAFYGTKGTLEISGVSDKRLKFFDVAADRWDDVPVDSSAGGTDLGTDGVQSDWNALVRHFAADIRGEAHGFYPTFADGWLASEIIDAIRAGRGWSVVPTVP